jgi:hypothetical protein
MSCCPKKRARQNLVEDKTKTIALEFDHNNKLITNISREHELLISNNFSNNNKRILRDLQSAIELINAKFLYEKKNLTDLRKQIAKRKKILLKTDDEILYQCKICYEDIIDTVIPCGHVFCKKCAHSSKAGTDFICPICRTIIKSSKKIYVS